MAQEKEPTTFNPFAIRRKSFKSGCLEYHHD